MCTDFGEDISFSPTVIAILVKLALPLTNILASLCEGESKFQLFIDNC